LSKDYELLPVQEWIDDLHGHDSSDVETAGKISNSTLLQRSLIHCTLALSRLCLLDSDRCFIFNLTFTSFGKSRFLPNSETLSI
jgi:hypothetical protein